MELFDLYTKDREPTGKKMVRGDRVPEGLYRLVVHVCIFDQEGRMLIQQRQPFKEGWSDMWDVTVGGSAVTGDSSRTAAERETSIAAMPAASAPQNADMTAMAHAGLGWPRKVTQESRRAKSHAQTVHEG